MKLPPYVADKTWHYFLRSLEDPVAYGGGIEALHTQAESLICPWARPKAAKVNAPGQQLPRGPEHCPPCQPGVGSVVSAQRTSVGFPPITPLFPEHEAQVL